MPKLIRLPKLEIFDQAQSKKLIDVICAFGQVTGFFYFFGRRLFLRGEFIKRRIFFLREERKGEEGRKEEKEKKERKRRFHLR